MTCQVMSTQYHHDPSFVTSSAAAVQHHQDLKDSFEFHNNRQEEEFKYSSRPSRLPRSAHATTTTDDDRVVSFLSQQISHYLFIN